MKGTNMEYTQNEFPYKMTKVQHLELLEALENDILERYNHADYWDTDIIKAFAHDNKLTSYKTN